jgi:hypothetical protein
MDLEHVGLFAVIHSLPRSQRHFWFVVHGIVIWQEPVIRRVRHSAPLWQVMGQASMHFLPI